MRIEVDWTFLDDDPHPLWADSFSLYAYLHLDLDRLLYVGKADYSTVRERLHGDHKADVLDDISRRYGIEQVRVLHGELLLEEGHRRSSEHLGDVESLLIMRLQPFGNIQSRSSRVMRRGLPCSAPAIGDSSDSAFTIRSDSSLDRTALTLSERPGLRDERPSLRCRRRAP